MADNVAITAGTGTSIAADEVVDGTLGTVKVGFVKLMGGTLDSTEKIAGDAANGLDVDVTRSVLPTGASTSANQTTANGSLSSITTNTANIPAQGQALAAASLPVVLTASQISTLTPPAAISGFATSAKQDTIIGHLDGVEALLTTIDADTSNLSVLGGGTEAAATRVTIANDSTGLLSIDDNGGSLTVDGTVTINAIPAGSNNIGDVDILSIAAGTNNIGDVDVLTMPTVTVNAHAVTNAGTFVTQENGALLTGVQLLDDTVVSQGTALGTVKNSMVAGSVTTAAPTYTTGQISPLSIDTAGALRVTGGGGGTEYVVNAIAPTDPTGATFVTERDDQLSTLTEIEGDWTNPRSSSKGALWVTIPDTNGDPITSFGGGTQYAEDAAHVSGNTGTLALAVRSDTAASTAGTDGDYTGLITDSTGKLHVNVGNTVTVGSHAVTNAGTFLVQNNSATPAGTNNIGDVDVLTVNGVAPAFNTGARGATVQRVTIATDDVVPITDNSGSLTVDAPVGTPAFVRLSDGAAAISTLAVSLASVPSHAVTNAGTFVTQENGALLTSSQLLDDTVATLGTTTYTETTTKGNVIGVVRRDANTSLVDTTNEVAPLQVNSTGELKVAQIQALPAGTNNIGDVDILTIAAGDNNIGNVDIVTLPAIPAGTNNIGDVDVLSVIPGVAATSLGKAEDAAHTTGDTGLFALSVRSDTAASTAGTDGDYAALTTDSTGKLHVNVGNTVTVGSHAVTNAGTFAAQSTLVSATTGGATAYKLVSAATTNATSVKGSAGTLYMVTASNVNAAVRYLKIYNKATAPTVGTDVPVFTFAIPGNTAGAGTNIPLPAMGVALGTGIAIATTTEATDAGSTAVAVSEIVINMAYA